MWTLIAAVGAGICLNQIVLLLLSGSRAEKLEARLTEIALLGEQERNGVRRWEGSLFSRAGKAFFAILVTKFGSILPISAKEKQQIQFLMARSGLRLQPEEYMVMQILAVLGGGLGGFYIGGLLGYSMLLSGGAGLYVGYTLFRFTIKKKATLRQNEILDQLPEILDLLSISVEAGLGFNQAFQYITEQCQGPLVEEFSYASRAMALGRTRRLALEDLAGRCGIDEVKSFTGAVIQADEMGISLRNILSAQAKEARQSKRMRLEERAQKIPIKMLLPMGVLIFPVLLIILMAPAVPKFMEFM